MIKKMINRYRNLKAPVKASFWFLICGFLQKGVAMLTTPIFTRIMTEGEYGRFTVYNSWLGIVQILISLNLTASVYTRGLVIHERDQDRFASSLQGLSTTSILIWAVIYAVFSRQINNLLDLSTLLVIAMLVESWANMAYYFWSNRERVHYRYKKMVLLTLVFVILRPLMGIFFVLLADVNHQVEARVTAVVGVNFILFFWLYLSVSRKGKCYFDRQYWTYALKFNIPLLPHYLAENILNQSDRLMINSICGSREAAFYGLAYTLAMVMLILNNAILSTMNPWIFRAIKNKNWAKIGPVSYTVLLLVGGMNLALILVAPELLKIMAPPSYQTALQVIPPVTVSVFFMFLYNLFVTFEYYFAKTNFVSVSTIAGALVNIALNAWLIPRFGFVAAAYTTLICYMLYSLIHYRIMRKICAECMDGCSVYNVKIIILISAGILGIAAVFISLYSTVLIRYALLLVMGVFVLAKRGTVIELLRKLKQR